MRAWLAAIMVLALICPACREQSPASKVPSAQSAAGSAAAPAPVPAGGRGLGGAVEEAFCKEHGVLEAVCTKCNPALIAVFKAKGDWCEEHGFPESFCPICHPERGGRPASDIS